MNNLSKMRITTRRGPRAGHRLSGAFALGVVLSLALAPAASAQVGVVKDTTHALGDTVTETGGKAGDSVTGTGSTVGGTLGGPLGGIVTNTTGDAGDVITGSSATAGGSVTAVGKVVDQTVEDTLEAVGGLTGGATNRQTDNGGNKKNGSKGENPTLAERGATTSSRTPFPLVGSTARVVGIAEAPALASGWSYLDARTPAELLEAAVEAVEQFAFPLALTLLVIAFLLIQNRIDNKDPKLAMAALDIDGELLSFS